MPCGLALISPWLDVSNSHTPPDIQYHLSVTSDALPIPMLTNWSNNITPRGMNPRDPDLSPFFDLEPIPVPSGGIWICYGEAEIFAPVIQEWIKWIQRQPNLKDKLQIITGKEMPHDYAISINAIPSTSRALAREALNLLAQFIIDAAED